MDQPAFPQTVNDLCTIRSANQGMTMRQWYKGMALEGLISKNIYHGVKELVKFSSVYADAMLAEDEEHERGKKG